MNHQINRLELELTCNSSSQAFDLRYYLAQEQQTSIINTIDECCSAQINDDNWLILDRLEIDLGDFGELGFRQNFSTLFKLKFEQALSEELSKLPKVQNQHTDQFSELNILSQFLEKGIFPWWANEKHSDINTVISYLLKHHPAEVEAYFSSHLKTQRIWDRISMQCNKLTCLEIINIMPALRKALQKYFRNRKTKIYDQVIEQIEQGIPLKNIIFPHKNLFDSLQIKEGLRFIIKNTPLFYSYGDDHKLYEKHFLDQSNSLDYQSAEHLELIESRPKGNLTHKFDESIIPVTEANSKFHESELGRVPIRSSGIVIVAPFLKALFLKLSWISDGIWVNQLAQCKAIHLLKYIGSGLLDRPEHELLLEKIICGLPIEASLPVEIRITESEIEESHKMLEAVLKHWEALKSTSIEGLRENFFQRDGLLSKVDNGWQLQVERRTMDVLLDRIPWGISQAIMPWNKYIIFVEW